VDRLITFECPTGGIDGHLQFAIGAWADSPTTIYGYYFNELRHGITAGSVDRLYPEWDVDLGGRLDRVCQLARDYPDVRSIPDVRFSLFNFPGSTCQGRPCCPDPTQSCAKPDIEILTYLQGLKDANAECLSYIAAINIFDEPYLNGHK